MANNPIGERARYEIRPMDGPITALRWRLIRPVLRVDRSIHIRLLAGLVQPMRWEFYTSVSVYLVRLLFGPFA